jgi:alkanesulfonate monooxygenase SsuD/methylene tetrahydromethanopterin reductase-like flavin-dependent oxidoreductase (luciferase family)
VTEIGFGVSLAGWTDGPALLAAARTAEREGFDVVTVADHLGHAAPFPVLATAAAVTTRVRLRTYVLDAYFWNPALLAREVATVDLLSGGRVELGIGAGHMRHEHRDAGLPFPVFD